RVITNTALQSRFGFARFHGRFFGSPWPWWWGGLAIGWIGPVFWPYVYYDFFDYVSGRMPMMTFGLMPTTTFITASTALTPMAAPARPLLPVPTWAFALVAPTRPASESRAPAVRSNAPLKFAAMAPRT